mgnify:CR=1 FL=1
MGPKSENVENVYVLIGFFERARGHLAVTKGKGQIPKRKLFKRISFVAVGKIILPSEGGKHIFKKLA